MKIKKICMQKITLIITSLMLFASCSSPKADTNSPTDEKSDVHYELAPVEKGNLRAIIKLPAQLAAYQEVNIFPKVNGYVKNVLVDIGSRVLQGQLLMTLEAPELDEASLQAKEKYAKSKSDYVISKENYQRLLQASQTEGAVSPLDVSTSKAKMEADSALSNAEKANWQMQNEMISYLKITAPFSGVITERNVHPGALINAESKDKPMLELKQEDLLRLEVDVPENIASTLAEKDSVHFFVPALHNKEMIGLISRKAGSVNMQYRTERIEIDVKNKNSELLPGMYADIVFSSKGNDNTIIVPSTAIVTSTERKYVIVVRNNKTVKIDVETGNHANGKTEVMGLLQTGEKVIVNANDEIKEGIPI
jgi:RND family efflux transporter MFP subunit